MEYVYKFLICCITTALIYKIKINVTSKQYLVRQQFLIDFSPLFGSTFDFLTIYLMNKQVVIHPTYRRKVGREEKMTN
jgi:hypothetical protein